MIPTSSFIIPTSAFKADLSDKLRRRIVGEINLPPDALELTAAGGEINLPPDALELTAAGGDVIESDKGFEMLMQTVPTEVKDNLAVTHTREFNLAKALQSKQI